MVESTRVANQGGDGMTTVECLVNNDETVAAGSSDNVDMHDELVCLLLVVVEKVQWCMAKS